MTIRLYVDEDSLRHALVRALRAQGVDVVTAIDAGMLGRDDADHLEYAISLDRVLFTRNVNDFPRLHKEYLADGRTHSGIVITTQAQTVGDQLRGLLLLTGERSAEDMVDQLVYLSAWIPPRGG
jgi:hypothetical protein